MGPKNRLLPDAELWIEVASETAENCEKTKLCVHKTNPVL